ncbi:hypothetical protein VTO73DRAFT_8712 [Trametes versicolor]
MPSRSPPTCIVTLRTPAEGTTPTRKLKVTFCPVTTRAEAAERRPLRSPSLATPEPKPPFKLHMVLLPLRLFQ